MKVKILNVDLFFFFFHRSRVRNAIKPGRYGYGKVPFALPLHSEKDEAQRFKRHHKIMTLGTTASPRKERKMGLKATPKSLDGLGEHGGESPGQAVDFDASSKPRTPFSTKPKRSGHSDQPSWPEKLANSSSQKMVNGFQHRQNDGESSEHGSLVGGGADSVLMVDGQTFNHERTDTNLWDAHWDTKTEKDEDNPLHPTENGNSEIIDVSGTRTSRASEKLGQKIPSTHPPPLTRASKPMQSKVVGQSLDIVIRKLASSHQVPNGKKSHDEQIAQPHRQGRTPLHNSDVGSDEGVEYEQSSHKSDSSHRPRSRSQRQSPYRHGTDGSRTYQSIFRDPSSRPSQGDTWAPVGRNPSLSFERGQDPRQSHHQNSEIPLSLYNPGTEEFHCAGPKKQHKSCTQEVGQYCIFISRIQTMDHLCFIQFVAL